MKTLPKSECNGKWKLIRRKKSTKKRSKTAELPSAHIKQNIKLYKFTITDLKNTKSEFKLYTIEHNLKRIYNEINRKNN